MEGGPDAAIELMKDPDTKELVGKLTSIMSKKRALSRRSTYVNDDAQGRMGVQIQGIIYNNLLSLKKKKN